MTAPTEKTAPPNWDHIAATKEFQTLIRKKRQFIYPTFALFFAYFFTLPILIGYAPKLMSTPISARLTCSLRFRPIAIPSRLANRRTLLTRLKKMGSPSKRNPRPKPHAARREVIANVPPSLPNLRSHHPSHHLLGRQTFPRRQQLFRSRPPNHRLAKRFRRSRRFHERRVIPRGNRPNRPTRFRRLLLFDRRLRSLRNNPSLSSRAAPQRRPLHHGRST